MRERAWWSVVRLARVVDELVDRDALGLRVAATADHLRDGRVANAHVPDEVRRHLLDLRAAHLAAQDARGLLREHLLRPPGVVGGHDRHRTALRETGGRGVDHRARDVQVRWGALALLKVRDAERGTSRAERHTLVDGLVDEVLEVARHELRTEVVHPRP